MKNPDAWKKISKAIIKEADRRQGLYSRYSADDRNIRS